MKVIYYSDDIENSSVFKNMLSAITEKDSLITIHSQTAFRDFIENNIIPFQKEVDCIIADSSFSGEELLSPTEIIDVTRNKPDDLNFSNFDFKLRSLPVLLVIKSDLDLHTAAQYGFNDILKISKKEEFELITGKALTQVKKWRKQTLDELDNIGIKFNSGYVDYSNYDFIRFRNKSTENLSHNFLHLPRKLNYYWTTMEKNQIQKGIDQFWILLKKYEKLLSLREEKDIHRFLLGNEFLLKRDIYGKHWYEPFWKDANPNEENKEPDFALKPNFSFSTDLSIVEVKLPTERFIKKRKYHPNFYSNIYEYLGQVCNYKDYLESDENQQNIYTAFKENPKNVDYKLLIGRKKDKEENQYHIDKKMRQFSFSHIELLTYDELIELQLKLLNELNLLEVR